MFIYFLQKKGWLGIPGQTVVADGKLVPDFSYLENHYERISSGKSAKSHSTFFYDQFLTGLFFDVLNTPRDARKAGVTRRYAEIPFLNGGLFQRTREEL